MLYSAGPKCKTLDNFQHIYEIPRALKDAISKPPSKDYDYEEPDLFLIKRASPANKRQKHQNNQPIHTYQIEAYKQRVESLAQKPPKVKEKVVHLDSNDLSKLQAENGSGYDIQKEMDKFQESNSVVIRYSCILKAFPIMVSVNILGKICALL